MILKKNWFTLELDDGVYTVSEAGLELFSIREGDLADVLPLAIY